MNLSDARIWFRYRCKITSHIKGNMSSMYKDNMACRYFKSGKEETQEHLEECDFTIEMRKTLDLKKETDKLILWRRITHALKDLYDKKQIKM